MDWIFNRMDGARVSDKLTFRNTNVVVMENELLRFVCLPAKGADIVSVYAKTAQCECLLHPPREFVINEFDPNTPNRHRVSFDNVWWEMFPVASSYGDYFGQEQPFHGEAHLLRWRYDILQDTPDEVAVRFSARMMLTPFDIARTVRLRRNQAVLRFEEEVTNRSSRQLPVIWGHHPTFGEPFLSEHCRVYLPKGRLIDGDKSILQIQPKHSNTGCMAYLTDFTDGYYGLFNSEKKLGFGMRWDASLFRVLWIWESFNKDWGAPLFNDVYATALEPVTSLPQTAADPKSPGPVMIEPHGTLKTDLEVFLFTDPKELPAAR